MYIKIKLYPILIKACEVADNSLQFPALSAITYS